MGFPENTKIKKTGMKHGIFTKTFFKNTVF
jgi:hypothetical protein